MSIVSIVPYGDWQQSWHLRLSLLLTRSIIALPMLTLNKSTLWYDLDKNDKGIIDEAVSQLEPDDGGI